MHGNKNLIVKVFANYAYVHSETLISTVNLPLCWEAMGNCCFNGKKANNTKLKTPKPFRNSYW